MFGNLGKIAGLMKQAKEIQKQMKEELPKKEFTASAGGDKVKWIEDMFTDLKKYPEIKAAVWFNSCDWDPDYPKETVVSRQYRLDENQATIDAFKNGVKDYKHDSLLK